MEWRVNLEVTEIIRVSVGLERVGGMERGGNRAGTGQLR